MFEPNQARNGHVPALMEEQALRLRLFDSATELRITDSPQVAYMLLELRPPASARIDEEALPLNIAIVIDRSTSMNGDRLLKVKQAAALVVDKLSNLDRLAIVSYSDRAEVIVPAGPVKNKVQIEAQIAGIRASGGTETLQGLAAGIRELSKAPLDQHVSHMILLTDGFTYGDSRECLEVARQAAERGIGISAFGLGTEWNDQFLDELVSPSGGQSGYIENPEQIIHFLRQRIQHLGVIYAQNLELKFGLPAGTRLKEAFKITPFAQPIDSERNTMRLGAIEGYTPLALLLELVVEAIPPEGKIVLPLTLTADIPSRPSPRTTLQHEHALQVRIGGEPAPMDEKLLEAVRLLNLHRLNESVWEDVDQGNIDAATRKMAFLTRRLEEAGLNQLAQTAMAESLHLQGGEEMTPERRMALKFGTRMQLTNSLTLMLNKGQDEQAEDEG